MKRRKLERKNKAKSRKLGSLVAWLHTEKAKAALVMAVGSMLLMLLLCAACAPQRYSLEVGSISHQTITATKDVVDELATESRRSAAENSVELTYHPLEGVTEQVMADLTAVFDELRKVQQYGLTLRSDKDTAETIRNRNFTESELEYAQSLVTLLKLSNYQYTTLLRTETADYDTMASTVTIAVENQMNNSIREGQVTQAIETIKQIVAYRVDISLMQNIVPTVLKLCVKANMGIDQTAAEEARLRAREAVEPVVYLQGQNIVREGEVVSANQIAMLKSLGLLESAEYDYALYGGVLLLVLLAVSLLILLLGLLDRHQLQTIRSTMVIMLVMVVSVGLCICVYKLLNPYLMPLPLAAMLLTGLLGWRAGLPAAISLSMLVGSLAAGGATTTSAEMVQLMLCGLVSGVVAVRYLKGKSQRVRMILCGALTAVTNLAVLVGMALMTSIDLSRILQTAAWSAGGSLLSGVLALGLQPVFETAFNLATPSKLLELGNPNQPLLRRLQIEASGTYHHSIIVANLAEAAAERIHANPLLARTGAYFHDIGKLKRPLYFKENQMGENPHDTTDPYVSAAIVTTHTRDGLLLAQKYHLPPEIQDIIVEHHGDTPVMYFYHKALQQSNGKPVNIDDFRYDGRRPTTRESAIIMLADTVEAAVRSMPNHTPQGIEDFMVKLVRGKLEDDQLSDAPLTLRDIDGICKAFCSVLNGVFHERIEYPTTAVPTRGQSAAPAQPAATEPEKPAASPAPVQPAPQPAPQPAAPAPVQTAPAAPVAPAAPAPAADKAVEKPDTPAASEPENAAGAETAPQEEAKDDTAVGN